MFDITKYKGATLSECKQYRFQLWRAWDFKKPGVLFIMLNPSTADQHIDDPTIRRCIGFAKQWEYGGIRVCNLFAYRATNPKEMKSTQYPISPDTSTKRNENDKCILADASMSQMTICAWGNHGTFLNRGEEVKKLLTNDGYKIYHLGLTKSGQPKHPLYLPIETAVIEWK